MLLRDHVRSDPIGLLLTSRTARWLAAVLALAVVLFGYELGLHQPLGDWLFFRYLRAAVAAAVFGFASLVAGHALLVRILGRTLPLGEHVTIALALGVLAFFLVSFSFGMLGWYGRWFFFGAPALLVAFGASRFARTVARFRRHTARVELRPRLGAVDAGILALGVLGAGLLWFTILTPQNASYDARWYHLGIAEQYVVRGGIRPFTEGWVNGAFPQLASLLYAWAFSAPGDLFDHVETAAHVELVVFFMTLVGVGALFRRVSGRRSSLAWVALFAFPGIFCYDSGLVLGADHVAALWAAPIFLLALRLYERPERPFALLLGAVIAGALDTKYTAVLLLPLPLFLGIAAMVRGRGRRAMGHAALTLLATVIVLTAPHWLKNAVYYSDPLFPSLRRFLPSRPWGEAAEAPLAGWYFLVRVPLNVSGFVEMVKTLFTFSFVPHDFPQYHGNTPVFGSLFTLLTPALLFFRRRARLTWLFAACYLGLALWCFIHQFDRYLQVLVPWMAAGTAVILSTLYRQGGAIRVAVVALVTLQAVWAAGVPFIPSHRTAGGPIQSVVVELLVSRAGDPARARLMGYPEWQALGRAIPAGATVLMHEEEVALGVSAPVVRDHPGGQGALYWGEPGATSPLEVWRLLRAHGVTHVAWAARLDHAHDTVAGGLVFFDFVTHHTDPLGEHGGFALARVRDEPPPHEPPGEVAYFPCDPTPPFEPGLYPLAALARGPGDRRAVGRPVAGVGFEEALARARFLVLDARCRPPLTAAEREQFELLAARGKAMLLSRRNAP
jgi:hypothetical protein